MNSTLYATPLTSNNTSGLEPYSGPWDASAVGHLLRRTIYGPSRAQIEECLKKGMGATLEALLSENELPDPPINYVNENDPDVPLGETWVDKKLSDNQLRGYRRRSLRVWTIEQALNQGISIREKMYLFWHNHFVISDIQDPRFEYVYSQLVRKYALGNFRQFTKEMTIDPAMLRYLNGNQNTRFNPNENYARELLELFTIGKGPQVGPGDYTHYTEDDVIEIAKILTGWRDTGYNSRRDNFQVQSFFVRNRHNTESKQLSHRFNNAVIPNMNNEEYAHLIDIIFEQHEVSRFISRKLYRWFVYHQIDQKVEQEIIEPLAQILRDHDYDVRPVLEALLSSDHFYQTTFKGAMIKSPLDYILGMINQFESKPRNENLNIRFGFLNLITRFSGFLQQSPFEFPDVAGWKAYYQEPVFYQNWISSTTMQFRQLFRELVLEGRLTFEGNSRNNRTLQIDVLSFIDSLNDATDPNNLIHELVSFLFPQPINQAQKDALKEVLLPGLPDYEWTVEYNDYLDNPNDQNLKASIEDKLIDLMQAITAMPEYYVG